MKIVRVETWSEAAPLRRPYTIATRRVTDVTLFFVRLVTETGPIGLGSASPAEKVTGETTTDCHDALAAADGVLAGRDARDAGALAHAVAEAFPRAPAARAALDMALHDRFARHLDRPLVSVLGPRRRDPLPTSITLGIQGTETALDEAREYLGRGFRCLKVKIGLDLDADLERLRALRATVGPDVVLRVDANQGYDLAGAERFHREAADLDLELVEQPLPRAESLRDLPEAMRATVAADESLHSLRDAAELAAPPAACGIWNIKLMKSGGVTPAHAIARLAAATGRRLMWGCMDESVVSLAAALDTAYASPATRHLDLDGDFDLERDPAVASYRVEGGRLVLGDEPGLGVSLRGD